MNEEMKNLGTHTTNKCIGELTAAFMPIIRKYHGGHIMKALAHFAAGNIAAQEDAGESLNSFIAMVTKQTTNCINSYGANDHSK
ncbi:MAG: hypothetical protein MUP21_05365 [Dehalococcoidia bacterium]|nr:hypothetical protein [Dehalococcoidia bacterium]